MMSEREKDTLLGPFISGLLRRDRDSDYVRNGRVAYIRTTDHSLGRAGLPVHLACGEPFTGEQPDR